MSWAPSDLVSDKDLLDYERTILTQFGQTGWEPRLRKALEDWLWPQLEGRGFPIDRFRTRYAPLAVVGNTSGTDTDRTATAAEDNGLVLSTILAASSDALYVGHAAPFRGLSLRMTSTVNAVASALTVSAWTDRWQPVTDLVPGVVAGGAPFSRGGSLVWTVPAGLVRRSVAGLGPAYWARLQLSAAPTAGTAIGPVSVIRRSRLCAAVTFRTLCLIFREAPVNQDGPWADKAAWYEREADIALARVIDQIGGEFDTDDDDTISPDESNQTVEQVTGGGWTLERA